MSKRARRKARLGIEWIFFSQPRPRLVLLQLSKTNQKTKTGPRPRRAQRRQPRPQGVEGRHERRGCCGDRLGQRGAAGSVRGFVFFSVSFFFLSPTLLFLFSFFTLTLIPPSKKTRNTLSQLPALSAAGRPAAPPRRPSPSGGAGPEAEGLCGEEAPGLCRRGLCRGRGPA